MQPANKTLILTEYENLIPVFLDAFKTIKIERYEGNDFLSSLDALKNKIVEDDSLSFIRNEILSFIKNHGSPFIIIDMLIKPNLDQKKERTKIFRTFLLSYIMIMESGEFKDISCNMFVLIDKINYERLNYIYPKAQNILGLLKTNNEEMNKKIHDYMIYEKKFLQNFNLLLINAEKDPLIIRSELILFGNKIIKSMGKIHG